MGIGFSVHSTEAVQTMTAGLGTDGDQLDTQQLVTPLVTKLLGQELSSVLGGFAAAERDRIHIPCGESRCGRLWHAVGASGFIGGDLHNANSRFSKGIGEHGAAAALDSRQKHVEPPAGHREVFDQAVGDEVRWDEIDLGAELTKQTCCLAADTGDLQSIGTSRLSLSVRISKG